jgi:molecular chaperone HscB
MEYILKQHDVIGKEGKNKLDQMFLMEMMDINEALMELQMDFDQSAFEKVISEIKAIESELYGEVEVAMRGYDQDKGVGKLEIIAKYYLKKKYLLRIKDNLDKFVDV